jgi:hypothetical protein
MKVKRTEGQVRTNISDPPKDISRLKEAAEFGEIIIAMNSYMPQTKNQLQALHGRKSNEDKIYDWFKKAAKTHTLEELKKIVGEDRYMKYFMKAFAAPDEPTY